jgi:hypothetical protein
MSENPSPGAGPGSNPPLSVAPDGSFTAGPRHAEDGRFSPPEAPRGATSKSGRQRGSRVILAVGLFVVLIAAVAWVSQYLPSWRHRTNSLPPAVDAPLRITAVSTVERVPNYVEEHERGVKGHHDYLFVNITDRPAAIGLLYKKCNCSSLQTCMLKAEEADPLLELEKQGKLAEAQAALIKLGPRLAGRWQPLNIDDPKGVQIPARSPGILRLTWRGRDSDDDHVQLIAELWLQPEGATMKSRTYVNLKPVIALVSPVRVAPDKQDVGVIAPREQATRDFLFWSATRDAFDLKVVAEPDPCLTWEIKRLGPQECRTATEQLKKMGYNTRVRSAYRLYTTLYEERANKQLDMGVVYRSLGVQVKVGGEGVEVPNPLLYGRVRSNIELVGADQRGKVNLQTFKDEDGTSQTVRLIARAGVNLKLIAKPEFLDVKLTAPKVPSEGEVTWAMEVTALPGRVGGEIPADTVIVLQTDSPGAPSRRLRIGVIGTAIRAASGTAARD